MEFLKSFFEIGSVVLLALTFIFGAGAWWASRKINERQATQLRDFDSRLTEAKTELGIQQQRTADALTKQQEVETELNRQKERTAVAEKTLLEMKNSLADRALTDEQVRELIHDLDRFHGQEFEVTAYWGSKESVSISERINYALQDAGWKYLPHKEFHGLLGGVVGIQVWTHPQADPRTRDAASTLLAALSHLGLQAEPRSQNATNPKDDKIGLSIGSKR